MRRLFALMALAAAPLSAQETAPADAQARIERAVADSGFQGVYAVSRNGVRVAGGAAGESAPGQPFTYEMEFPWAGVTEQAMAALLMQDVAAGRIALDAPASRYLPSLRGGARSPTVRELLQHRSGLRNPDDSGPSDGKARAGGLPSFYTGGPTGIGWCVSGRARPGGNRRSNTCDYLVLGGIVELVNRRPLAELFAERISGPVGASVRFAGAEVGLDADSVWAGGPDIAFTEMLPRFGSAGALVGTAGDMLAFDGGLLSGALVPERVRPEMWRGDPRLDGEALGQTSFTATLKGCAGPVRIVERRGGIGRFQVRNFIAPDQGVAMVLLTNRSAYDFGDVRQGTGAAHALLASALCPA